MNLFNLHSNKHVLLASGKWHLQSYIGKIQFIACTICYVITTANEYTAKAFIPSMTDMYAVQALLGCSISRWEKIMWINHMLYAKRKAKNTFIIRILLGSQVLRTGNQNEQDTCKTF